ncbi:hypothetical protein AURDEDRAFT_157410 [Auricularia subglabra TFB-10046 SS5]|nr:hypothetical protein AURDEDRAFT_157410 [Auricularia subglabra TFB-10046 SS5]
MPFTLQHPDTIDVLPIGIGFQSPKFGLWKPRRHGSDPPPKEVLRMCAQDCWRSPDYFIRGPDDEAAGFVKYGCFVAIGAARSPLARAGVDARNDASILAVLDDASKAEPRDLFSPATPPPPNDSSHSHPLPDYISAALRLRSYEPAQARVFTEREIREGRNSVTTKTTAHAIIEHPFGAVVEFPETGAVEGQSIAHRFAIDPEHPCMPHHSIQYSTGTTVHGMHEANCRLIRTDKQPVKCKVYSYTCSSVRSCTFKGVGEMLQHESHSFTSPSRQAAERLASHVGNTVTLSPDALVFSKTLAFFSALCKHGCSLKDDPLYADDSDDPEPANPHWDARAKPRRTCSGELRVRENYFGQMVIQCEHRSATDKSHLRLGNLQDYDTEYLKALLRGETAAIREHEESAAARGYGPLVTCNQVRSCRSQSQHCYGSLGPGCMSQAQKCGAKFSVYVPVDLADNPHVIMLCTNPHSHAPPERSMTPPAFRDAFQKMLKEMEWRLADATPRRAQLDSGFMNALRHALSWTDTRNPTLSDLHPSLQNLDHVAYLIDRVRKPSFPFGTDFDGARHLFETQQNGPPDEQYVRYVGETAIPGEKPAKIVICMSRAQSRRFLAARRPEIDSAYNRVHGWVEFEMEEWDISTSQSVTLCRAFVSSQSAAAHHALFREIFRIVEQDTGQALHFRHLHGDGIEIVTADEHKGQAKGFGLALVDVAQGMVEFDEFEPEKRLCDLTPYDHLARIYSL